MKANVCIASMALLVCATVSGANIAFPVPDDFRVVDGEVINIKTNAEWKSISDLGKFEFRFYQTNVAIAHGYKFRRASYRVPVDSSARAGGFIGGAGGFSGDTSYETKDKIYGEPIAVFNCSTNFLTGDDVTGIRVRRVGQYTVNGQVVAAYDAGIFDARCVTAANSISNQIRARLIEMRSAAESKLEQERQAAIPRIVVFQMRQASNGYPSFQFELAKRYLRGDGIETNRALAIHWLQSACTNGESQASNLLRQINLQGASK